MILGRFPASDDAGPVAPPSVFARVAVLEAEVERLRRVETAAREYREAETAPWESQPTYLAVVERVHVARRSLDAALEGRT